MFELRSNLTMLGPTKGMGHPSPPPSLANAVLRQASDGGSEGMAGRSPSQQIKEKFAAPPMSETIRMTVHARYRARWLSDVRIDVAHRKDKSDPAEFMCEQETS